MTRSLAGVRVETPEGIEVELPVTEPTLWILVRYFG